MSDSELNRPWRCGKAGYVNRVEHLLHVALHSPSDYLLGH
jgi:hypothetical protein